MADQTFFFYDLETSGFSPREARIMQFAGQRTTMQLELIGEPENHMLRLSDDILPDPSAVLLTGITPQMTITDGLTEAEFLKIFHSQIATPGTIFVGFNSLRFDDEFLRYLNYRNFHDAYEWHWSMDRSRWDMLDVVRMTRALRPEGIKWPFASNGAPTNRLEELASLNKLLHEKAHDALSDVQATIALARLINEKQPKLFSHLLAYRDKKIIAGLVESGKPFAYTSGKYPSSCLHTTAAVSLGVHPKNQGVFVFDLRNDPAVIAKLTTTEIIERWRHYCDDRPCPHPLMPIKTMQFNRCPAVAPLSVIDEQSAKRIDIDLKLVHKHFSDLAVHKEIILAKVLQATEKMDQKQKEMFASEQLAESALYDSFISGTDKQLSSSFINEKPANMAEFTAKFKDPRLKSLVPLYISKNYPKNQTADVRDRWEKFRTHKMLGGGQTSRAAKYFKQLQELATDTSLSAEKQFLVEELQLWGQSILPVED